MLTAKQLDDFAKAIRNTDLSIYGHNDEYTSVKRFVGYCSRCTAETSIYGISRFNFDHLCMRCVTIEKKHPLYKAAAVIEREACLQGKLNFVQRVPADLLRVSQREDRSSR